MVQSLRRGREAYLGDERVLGSSEFVEALRRTVEATEAPRSPRRALEPLVARVCRHVGLPREWSYEPLSDDLPVPDPAIA